MGLAAGLEDLERPHFAAELLGKRNIWEEMSKQKEVASMAITERLKERLDDASKELREAIDGFRKQVEQLSDRVRNKLQGTGEEVKETAEELTREIRELKERVNSLIPHRRRASRLPVRVAKRNVNGTSVSELQQTADRLFDDLYREFARSRRIRWDIPMGLPSNAFSTDWFRVDMYERDSEVLVTAELPGVDRKDVEVALDGDRLTVQGEKRGMEERRGHDYYHLERYYGGFHRTVLLPCEVDADRVEASFENGVLTVNLPKTLAAQEKTKKIRVRSG